MNNMDSNGNEIAIGSSPITEFYAGKSVLLTGFSGLLGKLVGFQLIKSTQVRVIYVLMRGKKGLSPQERLDKLTSSLPFTASPQASRNLHKLVAINGDLYNLIDLGISRDDVKLLQDNVSVVIHSAAQIAWSNDLGDTLKINYKATECLIDLCHTFNKLESFVFVSSAISFLDQPIIKEEIFPMDNYPDEEIDRIINDKSYAKAVIKREKYFQYGNCYSFSKALAENLIQRKLGDIRGSIVRPSIVYFTWRDPLPGWTDTIQGVQAIVTGIYCGFFQTIMMNNEALCHFVPADIAANFIIANAWYTAQKSTINCQVYNVTSGEVFPKFTFECFFDNFCQHAQKYPTKSQIRPSMKQIPREMKSKAVFHIEMFLYHTLFAFFADIMMLLSGRRGRFREKAKKANHLLSCIGHICQRNWPLTVDNCSKQIEAMTDKDSQVFSCDLRKLDIDSYFLNAFFGLRKYILREEEADIDAGKKQRKQVNLYYGGVWIFLAFLLLSIIGYALRSE